MPKVYIAQVAYKLDEKGKYIPVINLDECAKHGEPVIIFPPQMRLRPTRNLVDQARAALKHYDFEGGDTVLSTGVADGVAAVLGVLSKDFGRFTLLRWDKRAGGHVKVRIFL